MKKKCKNYDRLGRFGVYFYKN